MYAPKTKNLSIAVSIHRAQIDYSHKTYQAV